LFVVGEERRGELLRYDSKSQAFSPFLPKFSADHVSFSKNRQWMAYVQYPEGTLWRSRLNGTESLQLSFAPARAYLPRWSPDGEWIAFAGIPALGEPPKLYRVRADGLTAPEELLGQGAEGWSLDWSPNGNAVIFGRAGATEAPEAADIATLDLKTRKIEALPGSQGLQAPQWSPDGRRLAARAVGSRRLKLYDSRSGQWTDLGFENADYETWSQDGRYIYFNTLSNPKDPGLFRLRVADRKIEELYAWKDIMLAGIYGLWSGITPDGSLLILRDTGTRDIYAIDVDLP
jgi:Tol biopolymer transport system component